MFQFRFAWHLGSSLAVVAACQLAPVVLAQPVTPVAAAPAAAPAAGILKRLSGTATLERAGTRQPAAVGMAILVGDVLRTSADGAVGITLADDTLLTAGADSELTITAFSFDPTTHDGQVLASLWRGTLAVVTGLIGKKAPEKVNVQTRTVVLGVRGTEFIVDAGRGAK